MKNELYQSLAPALFALTGTLGSADQHAHSTPLTLSPPPARFSIASRLGRRRRKTFAYFVRLSSIFHSQSELLNAPSNSFSMNLPVRG